MVPQCWFFLISLDIMEMDVESVPQSYFFLALSLHNEVMPSIITSSSKSGLILAVRLPKNQQAAMMPKMRDIWAGVFPNTIFDCHPLTEVMADCYTKEQKLISLFSLASALAIAIACLGLLGLVSFTV